ncbi:MAG: NADP-dependent malic enzyme [Actinomycetia bacterium]|nr:NADP-dependent malic enzyme [Actinomycetes bacterium]
MTASDLPTDPVFALHRGGKIEMRSTAPVRDAEGLALAYTPGVAKVCEAIVADPGLADTYTWRSHVVAVVSDGTAVLGLGDIGPLAALPVMEGKALLFKDFGGIDAVPIVLDTTDVEEIVETVAHLAPSFGGINLEDISAPRCFEVERMLQERLDIPVFHDDQHGTAIVVLAALQNTVRLIDRPLSDLRVVVSGAGAAGVAVTKILLEAGLGEIAVGDSKGIIHSGRGDLEGMKEWIAGATNSAGLTGSIEDAMRGADVFIGVSAGRVAEAAVASMSSDAMVFSLANPDPEVDPLMAARYAKVVATGRSDFPNQINNVLAFPGIFKGALEVGATQITKGMKLAAANALAKVVGDDVAFDHVIPSVFDQRVAPSVAEAVSKAAREDGVVRPRR